MRGDCCHLRITCDQHLTVDEVKPKFGQVWLTNVPLPPCHWRHHACALFSSSVSLLAYLPLLSSLPAPLQPVAAKWRHVCRLRCTLVALRFINTLVARMWPGQRNVRARHSRRLFRHPRRKSAGCGTRKLRTRTNGCKNKNCGPRSEAARRRRCRLRSAAQPPAAAAACPLHLRPVACPHQMPDLTPYLAPVC